MKHCGVKKGIIFIYSMRERSSDAAESYCTRFRALSELTQPTAQSAIYTNFEFATRVKTLQFAMSAFANGYSL
jgi:hypothetical protein